MKTTITLTLPRMGTLALSVMMNTRTCLSHHEEHLEMLDPDRTWLDTHEAYLEQTARHHNRNYFLPCAYGIHGLQKKIENGKSKGYIDDIQILSIRPTDIPLDYMIRVTEGLSSAGFKDVRYYDIMNMQNEIDDYLQTIHQAFPDLPILEIDKEGRFFTEEQVRLIGSFTGAIDNTTSLWEIDRMIYLSKCSMSLSSSLLRKNILSAMKYV